MDEPAPHKTRCCGGVVYDGGVPVGGVTRIFPDLTDDLLLNLFHKGAQSQWTSRDLDWQTRMRLSDRQRLALARLLTPVYFGEQTAMAGASAILPSVMAAGETTAQLYLASFIMDEARHFETLTRLYQVLGHEPLSVREMPELLRYYHRLRQGDRVDWVWGILISDVIGRHVYRRLGPARLEPDPLVGGLSTRILRDESRHIAFAEHYLARNLPSMDSARRRALINMRDDLLEMLASMTERVRADAAAFDVEIEDFLDAIHADLEAVVRRIGLNGRDGSGPLSSGRRPSTADVPRARAAETPVGDTDNFATRCFGCLLSLTCTPRLATT